MHQFSANQSKSSISGSSSEGYSRHQFLSHIFRFLLAGPEALQFKMSHAISPKTLLGLSSKLGENLQEDVARRHPDKKPQVASV